MSDEFLGDCAGELFLLLLIWGGMVYLFVIIIELVAHEVLLWLAIITKIGHFRIALVPCWWLIWFLVRREHRYVCKLLIDRIIALNIGARLNLLFKSLLFQLFVILPLDLDLIHVDHLLEASAIMVLLLGILVAARKEEALRLRLGKNLLIQKHVVPLSIRRKPICRTLYHVDLMLSRWLTLLDDGLSHIFITVVLLVLKLVDPSHMCLLESFALTFLQFAGASYGIFDTIKLAEFVPVRELGLYHLIPTLINRIILLISILEELLYLLVLLV